MMLVAAETPAQADEHHVQPRLLETAARRQGAELK